MVSNNKYIAPPENIFNLAIHDMQEELNWLRNLQVDAKVLFTRSRIIWLMMQAPALPE